MKLWLIIQRSRSRSRFIFKGSEPEPESAKIGRLRNSATYLIKSYSYFKIFYISFKFSDFI